MFKTEFDFLTWTSFPSSAKLFNDEGQAIWVEGSRSPALSVKPGATIKVQVNARQENVLYNRGGIVIDWWDGTRWTRLWPWLLFPLGSFDWSLREGSFVLPANASAIIVFPGGGAGKPEAPGITWFDDLKIYQDDKIIYADDFSNWDPLIGAGIGAPIGGVAGYLLKEPLGPMVSEIVGAVLGGALGGGVGLLTGLGIIPVPQIPIPSLGAAPEGPGAPMRLGKYLITG